jgi:hypothetical protein
MLPPEYYNEAFDAFQQAGWHGAPMPPPSFPPAELAVDDKAEATIIGKTSLIVRNIGDKISQLKLMRLWPAEQGYDIFYMPFSFKRHKNLGFAFLNFRDHETALAFKHNWDAEQMYLNSSKVIEISWAETQGYQAHLDIINSYPEDIIKIMAFKPIVLHRR